MPLADPALPYGLRDVRLTPIGADGSTLGTPVDLPVSQKLSFSEAEEFEELRGDDRLRAIHGKGPTVAWSLDAGGISLDAWKVLSGGTLTATGTTPSQTKDFLKTGADTRSYFKIEGQSINDNGGDVHVIIYRAKCDDTLEGEFADGGFFVTACSGRGLPDLVTDNLYRITWNETASAIPAALAANELQLVIVDATGGTFTLTYSAQTTAATAFNATAAAVQAALEALSNIAPGDVLVTGIAGGPWQVEFMGTLANTDVAKMTGSGAALTGGSQSVAVVTTRPGHA